MTGRRLVAVALGMAVVAGCGAGSPDRTPSAAMSGDDGSPLAVSDRQARALDLTRNLPKAYRRVCAEQARYAPAGAGVCPPLIPGGRLEVEYADPFSTRPRYRAGYGASFASSAVGELRSARIDTNGGHWLYAVSWSPAVKRLQIDRGIRRPVNATEVSSCRHDQLGDQRVEICRVPPYEQGGGLHGGHVTYVWRHERATYAVSMHAYENAPRVRAMMAALIAKANE